MFHNTFHHEKAKTIDDLQPVLDKFTNCDEQGWPLVKKIELWGPFKKLTEAGFTLLDIPGNNDGNSYLDLRMQDGIDQCDKLYYVPAKKDIKSYNTVKELLFPPKYGTEFGMVINKAAKLDDEYNSEEKIQAKLKTIAPDNAAETQIEQTGIFLMENDNEKKSAQSEPLLDKFLSHLAIGVARNVEDAIDSLLSQVNLNLETIKLSVKNKLKPLKKWNKDIEKLFPTKHEIDFSNCPPQIEIPLQFPDDQREPDRSKPTYNTLQMRLKKGWYPDCITKYLSRSQIQFYERTIQDSFKSLCKNIYPELKNLSPEKKKKKDSLLECAFKSRKNTLLNACEKSFRSMSIDYTVKKIKPLMQWEAFHAVGKGSQKKMLDSIENAWSECRQEVRSACYKHMEDYAKRYFEDMRKELQYAISPHLDYHLRLLPNVTLEEIMSYLKPIKRESTVQSVSDNIAPAMADKSITEKLEELIKINYLYMNGPVLITNLRGSTGEVYVLSNPDMKKKSIYKIGYSNSLKKRVKKLNTASRKPFEPEITWKTTNTRIFENIMHNLFQTVREGGELFQVPLEYIIEAGDLVKQLMDGINE